MLKIMRNKELKKKMIWVVAIIIIISFGLFGTAYLITGQSDNSYAGKIFGKKVRIEQYQNALIFEELLAKFRYGDNFSKIQSYLNLDIEAWNRLMLLHEADQRKIKVYNDQLISFIESNKLFQKNGQFDRLVYDYMLNAYRISHKNFEEGMRENIKMALLYDEETKNISVSQDEVDIEFKRQNEQVQVSYITFSPDQFKDEKMYNETSALQYFEQNKESFLSPFAINVEYIEIPFADFTVDSTEESSEDTLAKQKEVANEKALKIREEIQANPILASVAEANDIELKQTGFFSAENPNLSLGWPFEVFNQIFKMNTRDIQEPFETSTGLVILSVLEKRDAYLPEYEEVKDKVKNAYLRDQAKDITKSKAKESLAIIKEKLDSSEIRDFAKISKELGLTIEQTPSFNRGQYLPQLGIVKDFENAAFTLSESNDISNIIETPVGYCILFLDNYTPADNSKLSEYSKDIEQKLLTQRKDTAFKDFVSRVRIKANLEVFSRNRTN